MIQLRKELQILRANGAGTGPIEIEETEPYQDMKERLERQIEDYQTALARFGLKITSYLRQKNLPPRSNSFLEEIHVYYRISKL